MSVRILTLWIIFKAFLKTLFWGENSTPTTNHVVIYNNFYVM